VGKFFSDFRWPERSNILRTAHFISMKYLSEKIQISFLSRSLLRDASHTARYSLCVQLHTLMVIPDVERVGRFEIVTLQNLNVLQPERGPQTVRRWNSGCQQARRTQQEEIAELQVTSKPRKYYTAFVCWVPRYRSQRSATTNNQQHIFCSTPPLLIVNDHEIFFTFVPFILIL